MQSNWPECPSVPRPHLWLNWLHASGLGSGALVVQLRDVGVGELCALQQLGTHG